MNSVAKYLMASYLYYEENVNVIPDTEFDELCKYLLEHHDELTHPHKHLVTKDNLRAGTCLGIEYPSRVKGAAVQWYNDVQNAAINED
jgi:hypothetical protein|tara:strand:+ start:922 stop:1185 length:264 start_codon:yes stop_codon:yes gene_type:complete